MDEHVLHLTVTVRGHTLDQAAHLVVSALNEKAAIVSVKIDETAAEHSFILHAETHLPPEVTSHETLEMVAARMPTPEAPSEQ